MSFNLNNIPTEQAIPYYEDTQKRTMLQKLRKIKNTLLMLLAYACPSNGLRIRMHRLRGVSIGKNVYLGMFCFLDNLYPQYIFIGDNVSINAGTMILTHFNPMKQYAPIFKARVSPVIINDKAIIAVRSIILPGVTIGYSAIISAASVVEKNVDPFTLVRGNPAKRVLDFELLIK